MIATAAFTPRFAVVPIFIAVVALSILATLLTAALPLSRSLRGFRKRPVRICVWGGPVMEGEIDSVRVFGAALHLFLTCPDQTSVHLKIAQPQDARITEDAVEIVHAAYVQSNGKKLPRAPEVAAVALTTAEEHR
jgi:hypothetical protein